MPPSSNYQKKFAASTSRPYRPNHSKISRRNSSLRKFCPTNGQISPILLCSSSPRPSTSSSSPPLPTDLPSNNRQAPTIPPSTKATLANPGAIHPPLPNHTPLSKPASLQLLRLVLSLIKKSKSTKSMISAAVISVASNPPPRITTTPPTVMPSKLPKAN